VNRRELLKHLGLGLTGGAVLPSLLASCGKDDPGPEIPYDGNVVVIGAGPAGMFAADILRSKGIQVTVLEANNQMGGRIQSLRNQTSFGTDAGFVTPYEQFKLADLIADFPVELGAEVIYGSNSAFATFASSFGLPLVDVDAAPARFILDNVQKTANDWGPDPDFVAVRNFMQGLPSYSGGAASMETAANVSARALPLLNAQAGNFFGSSSDRVNAAIVGPDLGRRTHNNAMRQIASNPMQDLLLSRFSEVKPLVQLNKQVKTISYAGEKVLLTLQDGSQLEPNKVIVAVPLGVLKAGDIQFAPGLPGSMTTAMARFGVDACVRLIVDFKLNFWGTDTSFLWGGNTVPQYFNCGLGRSQFSRTLSLTVFGSKAQTLSNLGAGMITPVLAELDNLFKDSNGVGQGTFRVRRITEDVNGVIIEKDPLFLAKDWGKDPFFKGGISYPLVSATADDRVNISAPLNNRVFFAGEHTDISGDAGNINGALASGERAANELIQAILAGV
jgi:monoamine oxidase